MKNQLKTNPLPCKCGNTTSYWHPDHVVSCGACFKERQEEARIEYCLEEGIDPFEVDPIEDILDMELEDDE